MPEIQLYTQSNQCFFCFPIKASTCLSVLFDTAGQPQPSGVPSGKTSVSGIFSHEWNTICRPKALLLVLSSPAKKYFTWIPQAL